MNGQVLFFALPCMLLRFSATTPITQSLDPTVVTVYLGCALAMVALAVAGARRAGVGWNDASFGALATAFPNSDFMGVPLLVARTWVQTARRAAELGLGGRSTHRRCEGHPLRIEGHAGWTEFGRLQRHAGCDRHAAGVRPIRGTAEESGLLALRLGRMRGGRS